MDGPRIAAIIVVGLLILIASSGFTYSYYRYHGAPAIVTESPMTPAYR